ncbi:MAG: exodeoxyribonuclease VII large subunit [Candidatus Dadabacteria bacterium]|nr:MAG: exodeoxyribonuclease VII large subunit [Candidatus Dadabacteria bacterium]
MTEPHYLTITEVAQLLNRTLEEQHPRLFFEGEIHQITRASSGHLYFTLKDAKSQISAVMWRGLASSLEFNPEQGLGVVCQGKPNVYHASGRLQIIVNKMMPSGEGELRKKFLKLKARLEKEGLFAEDRKRKLPFLPRVIGVVTSASGAAIHDMCVKINERMPSTRVLLFDVRVQGEGAALEIADGIRALNERDDVELIIVGRGGGSLQDLWAFNEEEVVRAIFASRIPVISAVGHEVDLTLSDLVADVRAPTPTAAAEIAVPRRDDLLARITELERRLADTERWFMPLMQKLDELEQRLKQRTASLLEEYRLKLKAAVAKIAILHPESVIASMRDKINSLSRRLYSAGKNLNDRFISEIEYLADRKHKGILRYFDQLRSRLDALEKHLYAVSPLRVLKRGYAIVEHNGEVVRTAESLKPRDSVGIRFYSGCANAEIVGIKTE